MRITRPKGGAEGLVIRALDYLFVGLRYPRRSGLNCDLAGGSSNGKRWITERQEQPSAGGSKQGESLYSNSDQEESTPVVSPNFISWAMKFSFRNEIHKA